MKLIDFKKLDKKDILYISGLFITVILIGLFNYKPGLILSGWDNLHPEFKPLSYFFDKTLFGVWHSSYGLGAIIANAPYTELFRLPFYFLLRLIFGLKNVRFVWHLLALFVGGLGFYFLSKRSLTTSKFLSFAGALFYMLNIGTLQNFYQPLEPFSHFFMFLPFSILIYIEVLDKPSIKKFILLFIINILGTPSFQVTPIFLVYFIVLAILSMSFFKIKKAKTVLISALIIIVANLFWVLPYSHFAFTGKQHEIASSRTYKLFSEEALIRNDNGSKFSNSIYMKGFWFNTLDNVDGKDIYILKEWINHLNDFAPKVLINVFLILVFVGLVRSFIRIKEPVSRFLLMAFFISFIALTGPNPPFGLITNFIRANIPLFAEVFRLSFTKFIILYSLVYSSLLVYGLDFLSLKIKTNIVRRVNAYLLIISILIYALPSFTGNFINSSLFSYIPNDYYAMAEYLDSNDPEGRILYLPNSPTFGWTHYSWGYRGSGFLWYLIINPVLDEAFEIHSKYNSDASQELKEAYLSNSPKELSYLMSKYDIKYLLLDRNINTCSGDCRKYIDEIFEKFETSGVFKKEKTSGNLKLLSRIEDFKENMVYMEGILDREDLIENYKNKSISKKIDRKAVLNIPPPYVDDAFSFYAISQENSNLVLKPYIPSISLNNIPVSTQDFDFKKIMCDNCSSVLVESAEDIEYWGIGYPSEIGLHNSLGILSFYNPEPKGLIKVEDFDISSTLQFCSNINNPRNVSVGWESSGESGVTVTGKKSYPCFSKRVTSTNQDFFEVRVSYKTNNDVNMEIAFTGSGENKKVYFMDLTADKTEARGYFKLDGSDPNPEVFFVFRSLVNDSVNINIKNLELGYGFEKIGDVNLPNNKKIYLDVKQGDMLVFNNLYPENAEKVKYSLNPTTYTLNDYKICSGELSSLVEELRPEDFDIFGRFFNYKSDNHGLCETVSVTPVQPKGSYLIETKSQNVEGGNLELCISENYTLYCKQKYKINGINRNILNNEDSKYLGRLDQVTIYTNHVAESDLRENKLYSMNFEFIPFKWLSSVSVSEDTRLVKAEKTLPFLYSAEVQGSEDTLVTNYQSYDKGWKILSFGNGCNFSSHIVKGWANGWDINCKSNAKIKILYLPQIYMFFGLTVTLGFGLFLVRLKRTKDYL